jgi:hypothetical protein
MGQTVSRGGYAVTRGAPGAAPGAGSGRERPPKFHWPPLARRAERAGTLPNPHGFSYGLGVFPWVWEGEGDVTAVCGTLAAVRQCKNGTCTAYWLGRRTALCGAPCMVSSRTSMPAGQPRICSTAVSGPETWSRSSRGGRMRPSRGQSSLPAWATSWSSPRSAASTIGTSVELRDQPPHDDVVVGGAKVEICRTGDTGAVAPPPRLWARHRRRRRRPLYYGTAVLEAAGRRRGEGQPIAAEHVTIQLKKPFRDGPLRFDRAFHSKSLGSTKWPERRVIPTSPSRQLPTGEGQDRMLWPCAERSTSCCSSAC